MKLSDRNVTVELTAADRAGMMRFTFPASDAASIMTDLQHFLSGKRCKLIWSHVRVEDNSTITGFHLINGWGKERYLYFAARYSRPFDRFRIMSDGKVVSMTATRATVSAAAARRREPICSSWPSTRRPPDEQIPVKVAVSAVSAANALKNLDAEIRRTGISKESSAKHARDGTANWPRSRSKARRREKETFYTALYHPFTTPNLYQDVTGEYRGLDQNIHRRRASRTTPSSRSGTPTAPRIRCSR